MENRFTLTPRVWNTPVKPTAGCDPRETASVIECLFRKRECVATAERSCTPLPWKSLSGERRPARPRREPRAPGTSEVDTYITPAAPSATATASRTAGSAVSRCWSRAWRAGSVPIRPRAHAAADRTTGSSVLVGQAGLEGRDGLGHAAGAQDEARVAEQARALGPRQCGPLEGGFPLVAATIQPRDQVGVGPFRAGPRAPASGPAGPCGSRDRRPGRRRSRRPSRPGGRRTRRRSAPCARSSSS